VKFNRRKRFAVYGGLLMTTAACMALVNGGSVGALTTTPTTVKAAADPTSSTAATATTASTSSTTAGPTTTTTVGTQQTTLAGKATNTNSCNSALTPALQPPSTGPITVTLGASGFPQPHKGQPIKLTKTSATITLPGASVQLGVTVGLLKEGSVIPSVITLVVAGSNTTEGTQTYTINASSTVHVVGGNAQDLTGTSALKDTVWHPKNATDPVAFTEKSLTIVSSIDASSLGLGTVKDTNTCSTAGTFTFLALSASGSAPPVTSGSTAPTGVTVAAATTTTTVAAAANTLPRTGANGVYLLIIAAALVDAGAALLLLTRRRRTL
jgi:LPXTG-motif cell wall-anchored protein